MSWPTVVTKWKYLIYSSINWVWLLNAETQNLRDGLKLVPLRKNALVVEWLDTIVKIFQSLLKQSANQLCLIVYLYKWVFGGKFLWPFLLRFEVRWSSWMKEEKIIKAKEREREYKIGSMWKYHSLCSDILQKNWQTVLREHCISPM